MKIQVTQENLSRALNNVAKVASGRNTLPILSNVLIKTVGKRTSISATNLNIAVTSFIGSKVSEEGSITAPARLLQDFVSNLPSGPIDITLEETRIHIKTENHKSTINGISSEDYPITPQIKDGKRWSINSSDLKKALSQVIVAASNDDARPILTGVNFHTATGRLVVVATDGYRLSEVKTINMNEDINITVPAAAVQELTRITPDNQEVSVISDDQQVLFKTAETELTSRLIEGTYPDYKKLIPKTLATTAVLSKSDFANIAKISSLFARESAGSVVVGVGGEKDSLTISSVASQLGENTARAEAKTTGVGNITLNSRYISDALGSSSAEEVKIGFNGKLDPVIIKDTSNDNHTHVIMPLKS